MPELYEQDDDPAGSGSLFRRLVAKAKAGFATFKAEVADVSSQVLDVVRSAFELPILRQIKEAGQRVGGGVYGGLENRYGPTMAKVIGGAFALPGVGLGASAAVTGAAEIGLQGRRAWDWMRGGQETPAKPLVDALNKNAAAIEKSIPWGERLTSSITSVGDWLSPGGIEARLAGAAMRNPFAAAGQFATTTLPSVLNRLTEGINTARNADLPGYMKAERIGDSLPVIGGLVSSLREFSRALDGTTERMRVAGVEHDKAVTRIRMTGNMAASLDPLRADLRRSRAEERAFGGSMSTFIASDRSTARGAVDYEEEQLRIAARDRAEIATRGAESAREISAGARSAREGVDAELEASRARMRVIEDRVTRYGGDSAVPRLTREETIRETALAAAGGPWGGIRAIRGLFGAGGRASAAEAGLGAVGISSAAGIDRGAAHERYVESLRDAERENERINALIERRRGLIDAERTAGVDAARATSEARRSIIDQMRTEADILRSRSQTMASSARTIGGATPFDRSVATGIARRAAAGQELSYMEESFLERFAPNVVARRREARGEDTELQALLRDRLGEFGTGAAGSTVASTRAREDELRRNIREDTLADMRSTAAETSRVLSTAVTEMARTLADAITTTIRGMDWRRLLSTVEVR